MNRITLICDDNFDGIMTAVYEAWVFMKRGYNVSIWAGDNCEYNLFSEYLTVTTDMSKASKVAESVRRKISEQAFMWIYRAAMHFDGNRANTIVGFLKIGYEVGRVVTDCLDNPYVMRIMELNRKVTNEAAKFRGFVRFKEIYSGLMYSEISPKCDILTLLAPHFDDRFPMENWIIFDTGRNKSVIHKAGEQWFIVSDYKFDLSQLKNHGIIETVTGQHKDNFEQLWKVFFDTISIESRTNPECQRNMIPYWYRKNMLEFKDENGWRS